MRRLLLLAAAVLSTACAGSDTTSTPASPPDATTDSVPASLSDGTDAVADDTLPSERERAEEVAMLADLSDECRQIVAQYFRDIEPIVEQIDFETAVVDDLSVLDNTQMSVIGSAFEESMGNADCPDVEPVDDLDAFVAFVGEEAPGSVEFLRFIAMMRAEPTVTYSTCDETFAYFEDLVATYDAPGEMPVGKIAEMTDAMTSLGALCTTEQIQSFYDDEDITEFLAGS